jgi:predicted transcriptional regulator
MPTEEKKKIQAWIPVSIWIQIESFGFKSQNEAVNKAFEKLIEIQENNQVESKNNQVESNMINELRARLEEKDTQIKDLESASREKYAEILRLQNVIQETPDLVELAEIKGLYEGKMQVIEEKNKRIEALEREISRLDIFAHYFKNVDVKQIEAPAEKKPWWQFW